MNITVLTTETDHHTWYVRELKKAFPSTRAIIETNHLKPTFDTFHSFENARKEFELKSFFKNQKCQIFDFVDGIVVDTINSYEVIHYVKKNSNDIYISFGVGKISPDIINMSKEKIINLHGGLPEKYRGLDSHLWAIYHNDFSSLVTTLHSLSSDLDSGDIILKESLSFPKGTNLYELRYYNTLSCLRLTLVALDMYARFQYFIKTSQSSQGRYYSFMPGVLKEICVKKFEKYTGKYE